MVDIIPGVTFFWYRGDGPVGGKVGSVCLNFEAEGLAAENCVEDMLLVYMLIVPLPYLPPPQPHPCLPPTSFGLSSQARLLDGECRPRADHAQWPGRAQQRGVLEPPHRPPRPPPHRLPNAEPVLGGHPAGGHLQSPGQQSPGQQDQQHAGEGVLEFDEALLWVGVAGWGVCVWGCCVWACAFLVWVCFVYVCMCARVCVRARMGGFFFFFFCVVLNNKSWIVLDIYV